MAPAPVRIEVPALPTFVGLVRSVVADVASNLGAIDDDRQADLRVAVSEACTNAVEAHRSGEMDEPLVVTCAVVTGALEVHIEDVGTGFSERTWGVQLIEALVDDATVTPDGERTSVRLRLNLGE